MKRNISLIRPLVLTLLVLASFVTITLGQEVQIPDPGLNAAIREALEQPGGPLTDQDLLRPTGSSDGSCGLGGGAGGVE